MLRLKRRSSQRWLWAGAALLVAAVLFYALSPILAPFLAAATSRAAPAHSQRCEERRFKRSMGRIQ